MSQLMPEDGCQMTEVRNQKSDTRDRSSDFGPQSSVFSINNQGAIIDR